MSSSSSTSPLNRKKNKNSSGTGRKGGSSNYNSIQKTANPPKTLTPPRMHHPPHQQHHNNRTPPRHYYHHPNHHHSNSMTPPDMTVMVYRVDLFDSGHTEMDLHYTPQCASSTNTASGMNSGNAPHSSSSSSSVAGAIAPSASSSTEEIDHIGAYHYRDDSTTIITATSTTSSNHHPNISIYRISVRTIAPANPFWKNVKVDDNHKNNNNNRSPTSMSNMPQQQHYNNDNNNSHVLTKYWNQRKRLFYHFDQGIQLDDEGWFSVTPEQIADHVANRLKELLISSTTTTTENTTAASSSTTTTPVANTNTTTSSSFCVLDVFCGCGGNAIAFAKAGFTVIAIDLDRRKLRHAANNAAIYGIPPNQIIFCECNALFVLEYCYRNQEFCLDQPVATPEAAMAMMRAMPPPVPMEICCGYQIGGIDVLPRTVHAVFMDPPWGGIDYEVFGKNGYDLERNMKIARCASTSVASTTTSSSQLDHNFFDTFQPQTKQERKAVFNCALDETDSVNGAELLRLAARVSQTVLYDIPRNTSRVSLGTAAYKAGYRGNCKLEEHYLNGRLKTATAYFGSDWRWMVGE